MGKGQLPVFGCFTARITIVQLFEVCFSQAWHAIDLLTYVLIFIRLLKAVASFPCTESTDHNLLKLHQVCTLTVDIT